MSNSLAPSTISVYRRSWDLFAEAMHLIGVKFEGQKSVPISINTVAFYIGHLQSNGYAPASITSYVTAISYIHRISLFPDPTNNTLIQRLLAGANKLSPSHDARLPITLIMLQRLSRALDKTVSSYYNRLLYRAMFVSAFFGLFRIGELTTDVKGVVALCSDQIEISRTHVQITIRHFKHNDKREPMDLILPKQDDDLICPVQCLLEYLKLRGESKGPLFCFPGGKVVSRDLFARILKETLIFCGINIKLYKAHSFRIGAASWYASRGCSDAQIRMLGRWKSDAFKRYIRCARLLLAMSS